MSMTVNDHIEDCKRVSVVIDNANALLTKTKSELERARNVLERLAEYQHPKMVMKIKYDHRISDLVGTKVESDGVDPATLIRAEISAINKLLGDRA